MTPLNQQAYLYLLELIQKDALSYDQVYSETRLAKEIGISRTPFRDAIHRLSQEGYVDIIPSRGFQLHRLTRKDVIETFQVRSAIECYCTYQIALASHTPQARSLFARLEELMVHMKRILETSHSILEFCDYDFQFHQEVIYFLENQQFREVFSTFHYRMRRLAQLSLAHEGRMEATYQEHLNILTALKEGNVKDIYQITLVHMDTPKGINLEDL